MDLSWRPGPLSKSLKNAQFKQETILQAALDLFLEQGYARTSMDTVAARAGVTKQTVYRYYPSKEELFVAVMAHIQATEEPLYTMGDGALAIELNLFGRDLLAFHLSPPALGVYKLMVSEGAKERLLQPFMQAGPKRVLAPLVDFLQKRFPSLEEPGFYAQMFAAMILAPRNQMLMQGNVRVIREEQRVFVEKVVRQFLKGLPV